MLRRALGRVRRQVLDAARSSRRLAPVVARATPGLRAHTAFGEDLLLYQLFRDEPAGIYVDVGAHDPTDGSLTHLLAGRRWRGFTVDAAPAAVERLRRARPDDTHLVAAIGTPGDTAEFVEFAASGLSSADPSTTEQWRAAGNEAVASTPVRLRGLGDVLAELGVPQRFELLTIDIEGLDEAALRSNDWDRFRPDVVCVEDPLAALGGPDSTPIGAYLSTLGYERVAALPPTSCFAVAEVVDRLLVASGADPAEFRRRQAGR